MITFLSRLIYEAWLTESIWLGWENDDKFDMKTNNSPAVVSIQIEIAAATDA